jgi:DNA-directed RNA polymerase specialized sigma24 family protein
MKNNGASPPTVDEVKRDLRRLRKLAHAIEAELKAKERLSARLTYLRSIPSPTEDVLVDVMRLEDAIRQLHVDEHIREAAELEGRYMAAIERLDPLDRAIIIDGYVNGKPYWKIGRDIGYTEAGIKKRVTVAIERIAAEIKANSEK